jgi:L-lactate dehydrogenase complex protein LldF
MANQQHFAESAAAFRQNVKRDLADSQLRGNFRGAMDYLMDKRQAAFADENEWQALQRQCKLIKQRCLLKLPHLLEQLEQKLQDNGIQVHWAETPEQANALIAGLITQVQGKTVVKGKSMVSEEVALNHYLEQHDIQCLETDMGEYIVQLADQLPSHIIMPAIHQNKAQVGKLFDEHIDGFGYTDDVDSLIQAGRKVLRDEFCQADIGITGVNFAVAETGTLCLVENEGNGRMSSTVPDVHIAITGIEKVIENLDDIPPLLSLLTRSATGQSITTYFNIINGPRKAQEKDGPQAVHLVLLDNGRSDAFADEELRQTLQCIRCGACMNHCPVYTRIGGHAYGTVYPGPIGKIISPHLLGFAPTKDLPTASSLCGACEAVCPVDIPIPKLLLRLRKENVKPGQSGRKRLEAMIWRVWAWIHASPALYRLATKMRWLMPKKLGPWTSMRTAPRPAKKTLHQLAAKHGGNNDDS